MAVKKLDKGLRQVLDALRMVKGCGGNTPSVRELAAALNVSGQTVSRRIQRLEALGYVRRLRGQRNLEIVEVKGAA